MSTSIRLIVLAKPKIDDRWFTVAHQSVFLDIENQRHSGHTTLSIVPSRSTLPLIFLDCANLIIHEVEVDGHVAEYQQTDPYAHRQVSRLPKEAVDLAQGLDSYEAAAAAQQSFIAITVPRAVKIREQVDLIVSEAEQGQQARQGSLAQDGPARSGSVAASVTGQQPMQDDQSYQPISVKISFTSRPDPRALHFTDLDRRHPLVYVQGSQIRCLFPCLDSAKSKQTWQLTVQYPRNFKRIPWAGIPSWKNSTTVLHAYAGHHEWQSLQQTLIDAGAMDVPGEKEAEAQIVSVGELEQEMYNAELDRKLAVFSLGDGNATAPCHIGFALGTWEASNLPHYALSDARGTLTEAPVSIKAYVSPGKTEMMLNTCLPIASALDYVAERYHQYPFPSYQIAFVDDMAEDVQSFAGLTLFSTKLLFPEKVIDILDEVTRKLIYGVISQWIGVDIVPNELKDLWIIVGLAWFLTDRFVKFLSGENHYQYQQKLARDFVCENDLQKPPLIEIGPRLTCDPSLWQLFEVKSTMTMVLLHSNIIKHVGSTGMEKVIAALLFASGVSGGEAKFLTTPKFARACEKKSHRKYDAFFQQWVHRPGFPEYSYTHRYNKKKLAIEFQIRQLQLERSGRDLEGASSNDILIDMLRKGRRRVEEDEMDFGGPPKKPFTGPLTIRIQQADGTPYEQLTEIRDAISKIDISYTNKFRRMGRVKRRRTTINPLEGVSEGTGTILYSLGDVLQTRSDIEEWDLAEPSQEEEEDAGQEPYDWIRFDADFESICKISQTHAMTESTNRWAMDRMQLQQDRDVIAQLEAIDRLGMLRKEAGVATVLLRTLMDCRYFWGVRNAAALALAEFETSTRGHLGAALLEKAYKALYCVEDTNVPHPNDFANRQAYLVRCGIIRALGKIDSSVDSITELLYHQLRDNNNSTNQFSDAHYICLLMETLTDRLIKMSKERPHMDAVDYSMENYQDWSVHQQFMQQCIQEIEQRGSADGYLPSFQNLLTRTYISCRQKLEAAGLATGKATRHWFPLLDVANNDFVRASAFEVAIRRGMMRRPQFAGFFFEHLRSSSSPWIRNKLFGLLEQALQLAASGSQIGSSNSAAGGGLEIEMVDQQEPQDLGPYGKILGALWESEELRSIRNNGFWAAATAPELSLAERNRLLRISTVFDQDDDEPHIHISFEQPRHWQITNARGGQLRVSRSGNLMNRRDAAHMKAMMKSPEKVEKPGSSKD